jgi:hypothetical protein
MKEFKMIKILMMDEAKTDLAADEWDKKHGSLLYMERNLSPFKREVSYDPEEIMYISLEYLALNTVKAILAMDMHLNLELYRCPYTDRQYWWAIPEALLLKKDSPVLSLWKSAMKDAGRNYHLEMSMDNSWNKEGFHKIANLEPSVIQKALLGPGYTEGTNANDGSSSIVLATADIDSGDQVLFWTHLWHNK